VFPAAVATQDQEVTHVVQDRTGRDVVIFDDDHVALGRGIVVVATLAERLRVEAFVGQLVMPSSCAAARVREAARRRFDR
jgi:CO dehydrogenase/acetyl-CoA synthase delta subunit